MRRFPAALLIVALLAFAWQQYGHRSPQTAEAIEIEPVVWQFGADYPGANPDDAALNVKTVYIKTHDGTDWMSTYDGTPYAVNGGGSLQQLIRSYNDRGIEVVAWFVPKGQDIDRQVQMAEEVLDSGVKGLYADVESFAGFCDADCNLLSSAFWWRLRMERPAARLGAIYDPRPEEWGNSGASAWLAAADVALPMCYWQSFVDEPPWNDPAGCVTQAHADLGALAPGRPLEYIPMLQGDSTADEFSRALEASIEAGSAKVSVWRRGVMPPDVWTAAFNASAQQTAVPPPLAALPQPAEQPPPIPAPDFCSADGCLLRGDASGSVYAMERGAKFHLASIDLMSAMGLDPAYVQTVPETLLANIPNSPADGTLFKEWGTETVYVMEGGARFVLPSNEYLQVMGFNSEALVLPPGAAAQVPTTPRDGLVLQDLNSPAQWQIAGGARFPLPDQGAVEILKAGAQLREAWVVPDGGVEQVPLTPRDRTHFKELGSDTEWQIAGGARFPLPNPDTRQALVRGGYLEEQVHWVAPGAMQQVSALPRDGTLFKELNGDKQYQIAAGAKFHVSRPSDLQALLDGGIVERIPFIVPDGAVAAISDLPRNESLVKQLGSDSINAIVCGALAPVTNEATLKQMINATQAKTPVFNVASGLSRFSAVPSDGCYVQSAAGPQQYVICGGKKWPVPNAGVASRLFGDQQPAPVPDSTLGSFLVTKELTGCPDHDGDGFSDLLERFLGRDPARACGANAWPPDVDGDGTVNEADRRWVSAIQGTSAADATYRSWADLNADGKIDKTDVDLLNAHNGETCAKPPAH